MAASELSYKGYTGSIEVSIEDGCLHGRILFINDLITYEGNTVESIKVSFENATDRYIAYCAKTGIPANKPYSGTFNIRIGADRHRALAQLANRKKISINEAICSAIDILQKTPTQQTFRTMPALDLMFSEIYKIQKDTPLTEANSGSATETTMMRFNLEADSVTQGNC
jgi:predicted HicB family RNase H-like nuclease